MSKIVTNNPPGWEKNWDKTIASIDGKVGGTSASAIFTLVNSNLEIIGQKTSCGCTVARKDGNKISATFRIAKFTKPESRKTSKAITVTLRDKVTNKKQTNILRFSGTVYSNESNIPS